MIRVRVRCGPGGAELTAQGHAGYAPAGQDIVCAAVSALMQTLAYSVDGGTVTQSQDDCNILTVQAEQSFDNMAKFELVTDGLMLLAQQYPENVRFVNLHANDTDNVDLQLFAATATTTACGRNREELLGPRSDFSKPRQEAVEKSANATRRCCLARGS